MIIAVVCVLIPTIALIVVIKQMFDDRKLKKGPKLGDRVMIDPDLSIPFAGHFGTITAVEGYDEYVVALDAKDRNGIEKRLKTIYPASSLLILNH